MVGLDRALEAVKLFHLTFGHMVSDQPTLLSQEQARPRADWMLEEINEFIDAETIAQQADAMIDLIYFALGTLVNMGVQPQPIFDIVQEANMAKVWADGKPHYRSDGKVVKPEGWEDPTLKIELEIARQAEVAAFPVLRNPR